MQYALQCKLAEKNNELQPKPFQIFLSGVSGVEKRFLVTAITGYLTRVLSLNDPSLLVTASTVKTSAGVNGITLHSAFHLPIKSGLKSYGYKKPGDEILLLLRNKYQYLKVLIIDEIFIVGREKFEHLDLALQAIKQSSFPFGRVSLLVVGDFLKRHLLIKKVCLKKQERVHIGHSTDGCGNSFGFMRWLKLLDRAVTQMSLSYLIWFQKVNK